MEGMVQQDGSSYILGDQSTHHRGSITSPEFPVTGDLLFIPNGEAWTGATWKNNLLLMRIHLGILILMLCHS